MKPPAMEVADVIRTFGGQYMKAHAGRMPAMHRHRQRLNALRETLEQPAGDEPATSIRQVDTSPSESSPATPPTCRHCGRPMLVVEIIPRYRPMSGWPNAPPDQGRSARNHQSKQTANSL